MADRNRIYTTRDINAGLAETVVERAAFAPLAVYADNKVRPALPAMIHSPVAAFHRMLTNPTRYLDQTPAQKRQTIGDAIEVAGAAGVGGLLSPKPAGALGTFGGKNAATADLKALETARRMAGEGASRESIWAETGWFQGPDKHWRFEIDDSKAVLDRSPIARQREAYAWKEAEDYEAASIISHRAAKEGTSIEDAAKSFAKETGRDVSEDALAKAKVFTKEQLKASADRALNQTFDPDAKAYSLGQVLNHPELYAAYPDLAARPYKVEDLGFGVRGAYQPTDDKFYASKFIRRGDPAEQSTGLHEVQHALQARAGFSPGANPKMIENEIETAIAKNRALRDNVAERREAAVKARDHAAVKREADAQKILVAEYGRLALRDPMDEYRRSAGEVEARLVQKRMGMSAAERRANPPWAGYDVPEDKIIVRNGNGKALYASGTPGLMIAVASQGRPTPVADKVLGRDYKDTWTDKRGRHYTRRDKSVRTKG